MYKKIKELAKSNKIVRGFLIVFIAVRVFFQLIKKYYVSWKEERKKKKEQKPVLFNKDGSVSARGKALAQKSRFIRCFLVCLIVVRVFCKHIKMYYADWRAERKQGLNNSDGRTFDGKWMCGWKIAFSMCVAAIALLCCDSIMASYAAMGRRQDEKVTKVDDKEVDLESKRKPLQEISFHYTRGINKRLFEDELDLDDVKEVEYPKEATSENGSQKMSVSSSGFSSDLYEGENDVVYPLVIRNNGSEELTDIRVNAEIMQLAGYDEKMAEILQREAEKKQTEELGTNPEEPDTETEEPETNPEEPDTGTAADEPETEPEEPDTETEEPGTNPEEPDTDTVADEPETKSEEPSTETEEPETNPEEPDTDTVEKPDTGTEEPETNQEKSDTDTVAEAPERKPIESDIKIEEPKGNPEAADMATNEDPEGDPEAADITTDEDPEGDPEAADITMDEESEGKPEASDVTADEESETKPEEPETVTEEADTVNKIFVNQMLIGKEAFESTDLIVSEQIIEIDNLKELTFSLQPDEEVTLYLKLSEECTYGEYKDCLTVEAAGLEQPCSIEIAAKVYAKEGEPWRTIPDRTEPVIAYSPDILEGTMGLTDTFEFQVLESEGFDSGIALVECYLNGSLQDLESEVVETALRDDGEVATGIKYQVPFTEEGINSLTIKAVDQEGNQCIQNLELQVVKEEDYHVIMSKKIELTVDPAMAYGDTQIFNLRDCIIDNDSIEDLAVNIEEVLVMMNGDDSESITEKIRSLNMAIVVDGEKIYDMPIGAIDSVNTCNFIIKGRGKEGEVSHKAYLVFSGMLKSEEAIDWHEDDLEVQLQIKFAQAE